MLSLLAATKKPKPITISASAKGARTEEHQSITKKLGITTPTHQAEALEFMDESGVDVFDTEAVSRFMDKLSLKSGERWCWVPLREKDGPPDRVDSYTIRTHLGWCRFLLASGVAFAVEALCLGFTVAHPSPALLASAALGLLCLFLSYFFWDCGAFRMQVGYTTDKRTYNKPVPLKHLKQVGLLAEKFPTLQFYVSDYDVPDPDPFIMCTTHTGWRIVFGVWDEPTFGT